MSILSSAKEKISNLGANTKDVGNHAKPQTTLPYNQDVKKGPVITSDKTNQVADDYPDEDGHGTQKTGAAGQANQQPRHHSRTPSSESTGSTKSERRKRLSQNIAKKINVKSGVPLDKQVDGAVRELQGEQVEDYTDEPIDVLTGSKNQKGSKNASHEKSGEKSNEKSGNKTAEGATAGAAGAAGAAGVAAGAGANKGTQNTNKQEPGLIQKGVDTAKSYLGYNQNHDEEELKGPEVKHPHKIEEELGMAATPEGRGDLEKKKFLKSEEADPNTRDKIGKQSGYDKTGKQTGYDKTTDAAGSKHNTSGMKDSRNAEQTATNAGRSSGADKTAQGSKTGDEYKDAKGTHESGNAGKEAAGAAGGAGIAGGAGAMLNHSKDIGADANKLKDGHIPDANEAKDMSQHGKNLGKDANEAKNKMTGKGSKSAGQNVADETEKAKSAGGNDAKNFANKGQDEATGQGKEAANKASGIDKSGAKNAEYPSKSGKNAVDDAEQSGTKGAKNASKSGGAEDASKGAEKTSKSGNGNIVDDGKQLANDAKGLKDGKIPDGQQAKDIASHGKQFGNDAKNSWGGNNQSSGGMKAGAGAAVGAGGAAIGATVGAEKGHKSNSKDSNSKDSKSKDSSGDKQKDGPKHKFLHHVVDNAKEALHIK